MEKLKTFYCPVEITGPSAQNILDERRFFQIVVEAEDEFRAYLLQQDILKLMGSADRPPLRYWWPRAMCRSSAELAQNSRIIYGTAR
jgi:hypothetical protein